jgi:prepilin-type N-terminal cleavage/methylation domain-containing protein
VTRPHASGGIPSRPRGASGFTLVELLVALALIGLGLGALALMSTGVLAAFDADPAAAEQQQRGRATMAAIVEDAARAGMSFVDDAAGVPGRDVPSAIPDGWRHGAWTVGARPSLLAVMAGARTAAHARLPAAGETRLVLERPGYCSPASPTCRFAAGDDVLLAGPDGAFALAAVRAASPPLVIDLVAPLAQTWPAGTRISVVETRTYALRADAATGLDQIVRRQGTGPAMPLVDFVQGFEVEWLVAGAAPAVRLAPDATPEHTTYGPLPPAEGVVGDPAWPAGENCVFARDAAGASASRLAPLGSGAVAASLSRFVDGPWCPSPAAPTRWDADLSRVVGVRVRVEVAVASALLRPPFGAVMGPPAARRRLVPTLALSATAAVGRASGPR